MLRDEDAHFDVKPGVLVIASDDRAADSAEAAVAAAGARRLGRVLPDALADTDMLPIADAVLVEIGPGADWPDALGDAITALRRPAVIAFPPVWIDAAAAGFACDQCILLCDPDPVERAAALAIALATPTLRLNDVRPGSDALRLRQLSEEVGRIARALAGLSSAADPGGTPGWSAAGDAAPAAWQPDRPLDANDIRALLRARRLRGQFFDVALFADPAWDMLLDLMAARIERRPVSVSSLCIAAAVPQTTALRWIKTLTDEGLVRRVPDPHDARRVFIELEDAAATAMARCLSAMSATATMPA